MSSDAIPLEKSQGKEFTKHVKKLRKQVAEKAKERKVSLEKARGLIYIGHLPHGFYEEELKEYFSQFGKVTNARVCRSKNTGNSKGYGFVEFLFPDVAKVAAETMDNYVMFKKRLICKVISCNERPKAVFPAKQNSLSRCSKVIRRKKQILERNKDIDEKTYAKKVKAALLKHKNRIEKLKKYNIKCNVKPQNISLS